jgi:mRNA interferase RelE/StbE
MRIELHPSVRKFVLRLNPKEQARVLNAIYKLPSGDVKPLSGRNGEYRLRVGGWRAIFEYRGNIIFVTELDNRGDIYK